MNNQAYGVSSMVAPLKRVAMRRPGREMLSADPDKWHYAKEMMPEALLAQYQQFVDLMQDSGAEIIWMNDDDDGLADSVFTYDASLITPAGAILMNPGKILRKDEVELHASFYKDMGIPVIGAIEAPGRAEGGDSFWLDDKTLAVGRGFRTNQAGIDQLRTFLEPQGIKIVSFDLPVYTGKDACLHLMSIVSSLGDKLAIIYAPLMPVRLYEMMLEMGYRLLEAPQDEFENSGGLNLNVLATKPMHCITVDGFPKTRALLEEAGCKVDVYPGDELSIPCEGGPTCMTRPLLRS